MPKINELTRAQTLAATDLFAAENTSGTSTRGVSAQQIKDFATDDVSAEVADLKNATNANYDKSSIALSQGSIVNGIEDGSSIYIRSGFIEYGDNDVLEIVNASGTSLVVTVFYYTFNGERYYTSYEDLSLVANGTTARKTFTGSGWYRFRCCLATEVAITPSDLTNTFYKLKALTTANCNSISVLSNSDDVLADLILGDPVTYNYEWKYGVPNPANGTINNVTHRICTSYIKVDDFISFFTLEPASGYQCAYYAYDANKNYIEGYYWYTSKATVTRKATWKYLIIACARTSGANMDVSEGSNLAISWEVEASGTVMNFEQGSLYEGQEYSNSKYVRTNGYVKLPKGTKVLLKAGANQLVYRPFLYNFNNVNDWDVAGSNIVVNAGNQTIYTVPKDTYLRLMIGKGNETDITPSDVSGFVQYYRDDVLELSDDVYENGLVGPYIPDGLDTDAKLTEYCGLFNDSVGDSYVFFTDPHLMGTSGTFSELLVTRYMSTLAKYYAKSPACFVVCGGDWLNNGDTEAQGKTKLGYINGMCRDLFGDNFINIVGNHDTNYFGTGDSHTLSAQTIANLFNGQHGKNYYKYKTSNSQYYILDTEQAENDTAMNAYRWEQIAWLANSLAQDDPAHGVLMFHIFYLTNTSSNKMVFSTTLGTLIEAYNSHTTVTLNGTTYNFTGCSGKIVYCLVGHSHADFVDTIGGVPVIGSINMQGGKTPSFDMIFVDYTNMIFHAVRVGNGSSRNVNLTTGQLIT